MNQIRITWKTCDEVSSVIRCNAWKEAWSFVGEPQELSVAWDDRTHNLQCLEGLNGLLEVGTLRPSDDDGACDDDGGGGEAARYDLRHEAGHCASERQGDRKEVGSTWKTNVGKPLKIVPFQ